MKKTLFNFIIYAFTFRYFLEQVLKISMSIVIEIIFVFQITEQRELQYANQYKILIGVSGFIYIVFMSLLALTIY